MSSLHQSNELFFKISYATNQENTIKSNTMMDHAALDGSNNNLNKDNMEESRRRRRKSLSTPENNYEMMNNNNNTNDKKMIHREVERQRRQEMNVLYSSLRSQLPLEYIKGKRSISDHMNEAVNYIKHLQKKNKELGVKRDELRKFSITSSGRSEPGNDGSLNNKSSSLNRVIVHACYLGGVEIVINNGFKDGGLTLSRVLKMLLEEGLDVVSCVSAEVNGRLLHTIQTEAGDQTIIDLSGMQRKLTNAILIPPSR